MAALTAYGTDASIERSYALKTKINVNYIQIFSSYRAVNIPSLLQKPINAA